VDNAIELLGCQVESPTAAYRRFSRRPQGTSVVPMESSYQISRQVVASDTVQHREPHFRELEPDGGLVAAGGATSWRSLSPRAGHSVLS
jgi:hypothetical protein